mgnify:CR=1 FL=1
MTHFWPAHDPFTYGGATHDYGTALNAYFRVRPHSSATSDPAAETTTGYGLVFAQGQLFDGYQLAGINGCGFAQHSSVTTVDCLIGAAWRHGRAITGDIRLHPRMSLISGGFNSDSFRGCGVFGRFRTATLAVPAAAPQDEEFFRSGDCYAFLHVNKAANGSRFKLLRFNAGVISVIGDAAAPNQYASDAQAGPNKYGPTSVMRMTIENDVGGNPNIKCYARRFAILPNGLTAIDTQIFFVIDTTGSKIDLGGYWGFIGQPPRIQASVGTHCVLVDTFSVADAVDGTAFVEDQFVRRDKYGARVVVDTLARSGRSFMSYWTGDQHGTQDTGRNHYFHIKRHATLGEVEMGGPVGVGTSQVHGWYISQRGAATDIAAGRSIAITPYNVETTNKRRHGIALRMQLQTSAPDYRGGHFDKRTGYMLIVKYQSPTAPIWLMEWWHFNGDTSAGAQPTILATADVSALVALGTAFTLKFECQNSSNSPNGTPVMLARIGGTTVTPVPSIAGVLAVNNYLFDARTAATKSGYGEGFYFHPDTLGAVKLVDFDAWAEETITVPPIIGDNEQASVVLSSELTGQTGTLDVPLSWPIVETRRYESYREEMELGHTSALLRFPRPRRRWRVGAHGVTTTERQTLLAFFDAHKGVAIPFSWAVPLAVPAETVAARFVRPDLMTSLLNPLIESFDFELEELFAPTPPV